MDLKEFVAESLKEVIDGVKSAQTHANQNGAEICPTIYSGHKTENTIFYSEKSERTIEWVNYDIAVTAEEVGESGGGGKLSIKVASIFNAEGGAEIKSTEKASSLSRIQFRLPVVWPAQHEHSD